MRCHQIFWTLLLSLLFMAAQAATDGIVEIPSPLVAKLGSQTWETREDAFRKILQTKETSGLESQSYSPEVQGAMIRLLKTEAQFAERQTDLSEQYSEYFADLIQETASLRNPEAFDALISPAVLSTGGSIGGVAMLGDAAAPRVIALLQNTHEQYRRLNLIEVLVQMNKLGTIHDQGIILNAEKIFLRSSQSSNRLERMWAYRGLSGYDDPPAREALNNALANDPDRMSRAEAETDARRQKQ